jgi:hypothetical protein
MRISAIALAIVLGAGAAAAQQHKRATINAETPEGQLLQQIGTEQDEAKKIALLEDFAAKYPKHEGLASVYEQMVAVYTKAGQFDKAVDAGGKLLALDSEDVVTAHACLKASEAKKDPDLVLKWSETTSGIARKVAAAPKPSDEDAVEEWTRTVDFAKQVDVYTEYALYAAMLQTADPAKKIALGEALEKRNPSSQYLPQMTEQRFQAYMQPGGNAAKGVALAEKEIEKNQASVEMLLAVAGNYMGKAPDKVLALSKKAIEIGEAKPKPEGVADADWQTWKAQIAARAHWMAGITYAGQSKWAPTDQELRAALPGVRGAREMLSQALFYLGVANYRLAEGGQTERARDAIRFSTECAAIPGPLQASCRTNIKAIRAQYHVQ